MFKQVHWAHLNSELWWLEWSFCMVSILDGRGNWIKLFIQLKHSSKLGWISVCDLVLLSDGGEMTATLLIHYLVQPKTFDD